MSGKHPFGLKKDPRHKEEEHGAGAALPGVTAAGTPAVEGMFDSGAAALSTIGRAAPGGLPSAGLWESAVGALARATGLGPAAAGKVLVVGLVVGASALAAGLSLMIGNGASDGQPRLGPRVFAETTPNESSLAPSPGAPAGEAPAPAAPSSLEYLSQANAPAAVPEATPDRAVDAPAALPAVQNAQAPAVHAATPAAPARVAAGPKPQLAKKAMVSPRGDPGGKTAFQPLASIAGQVGNGFQDVYRPKSGAFDAMAQKRPNYAARRSLMGGDSNAMAQARFTQKMSQRAMGMSASAAAGFTASQPFDGANHAAQLGATRASGDSMGGAGVGSSADSIKDSRSVSPPPAPSANNNGQNKTPYQGLVMAAMAALAVGALLLMAAGQMADQGKTDPSKMQAAQALAAAAMAAGGAAAGMGGMLAGQYGQMTQGMPFIMGGGIIALQAGMVIAKGSKAGQDGAQGTSDAGSQAMSGATQALGSAMGPAMQAMNGNQSGGSNPPPKSSTPSRGAGASYSNPMPPGATDVPNVP